MDVDDWIANGDFADPAGPGTTPPAPGWQRTAARGWFLLDGGGGQAATTQQRGPDGSTWLTWTANRGARILQPLARASDVPMRLRALVRVRTGRVRVTATQNDDPSLEIRLHPGDWQRVDLTTAGAVNQVVFGADVDGTAADIAQVRLEAASAEPGSAPPPARPAETIADLVRAVLPRLLDSADLRSAVANLLAGNPTLSIATEAPTASGPAPTDSLPAAGANRDVGAPQVPANKTVGPGPRPPDVPPAIEIDPLPSVWVRAGAPVIVTGTTRPGTTYMGAPIVGWNPVPILFTNVALTRQPDGVVVAATNTSTSGAAWATWSATINNPQAGWNLYDTSSTTSPTYSFSEPWCFFPGERPRRRRDHIPGVERHRRAVR